MKSVIAFGVAAALAVAAFGWGLNHGIRVGVEETTRFYWTNAPVCQPPAPYEAPIPTS